MLESVLLHRTVNYVVKSDEISSINHYFLNKTAIFKETRVVFLSMELKYRS